MNLLLDHLTSIIRQNLCYENIGILYSGGLDSSIILRILIKEIGVNRIHPVTVGVKGSYDIENALKGARELNIDLNLCSLNNSVISNTIESLSKLNVVSEISKLLIAIPLFVGMRYLSLNGIKHVFLGQGADELFGGYKKYVELYRNSSEIKIRKMMDSDLLSLTTDQMVMEKRIGDYFGISLVYPFLSPDVIKYAKSIPIKEHIIGRRDHPIRKAILRALASNLDLSPIMASQPKKALQYGSGTLKLLRKIAKDAGYPNLPSWFDKTIIVD